MIDKFKNGFTLAETLLVILIIGIVAMLVIPPLISNIQKNQYVSAWKKAYADLSQASKAVAQSQSGSLMGTFTKRGDFRDLYAKNLSVIKKCNYSVTDGCWHKASEMTYFNGSPADGYHACDGEGLILNNGVMLAFCSTYNDCSYTFGGSNKICSLIYIDTNGFKEPNTFGKDIFMTELTPTGELLPVGNKNDNYCYWYSADGKPGKCDSGASGEGCATRYLAE